MYLKNFFPLFLYIPFQVWSRDEGFFRSHGISKKKKSRTKMSLLLARLREQECRCHVIFNLPRVFSTLLHCISNSSSNISNLFLINGRVSIYILPNTAVVYISFFFVFTNIACTFSFMTSFFFFLQLHNFSTSSCFRCQESIQYWWHQENAALTNEQCH